MPELKTVGLFLVTALAEIVGCYLPYLWLREGKTIWLLIPGALHAGLVNPTFWWGMGVAFVAAYATAHPVNRLMLRRGQGHARSHGAMGDGVERAWVPDIPAPALAGALAAFLAGGLLVSIAA
ncbi:DUF4396 domain-containing protein [uncultured Nocardioides sp.]|uniref:DUF4396 domain-containing protein n=1 Tax=uncultured Nocardioides sp. TaxID=198441 RepID=UPI00261E5730|nr:DUF4396 domain-containing protein [uncultured Nocardioides sp.]